MVELVPRLRRFAYVLAGSKDDGDDLVQAACERALARLDQFEPGTRLDSWMFRIVQTIWLDRGRRRRTTGPPPAASRTGSRSPPCGGRSPRSRTSSAR
jgi:RNA polymerase sigma-70 factor (ECF subfamily)